MNRVVLHIDTLVLRGLDHTDARTLQASLQAELQKLLAHPHAAWELAHAGHHARAIVAPAGNPQATGGHDIGQRIARSIVKGGTP